LKMLLIHADHFEYSVRQPAIKNPEKIGPERKSDSLTEVLVAFCTVEKDDEINASIISTNAVETIDSVAKQVEVQNIMVYPYAHLSPSLGSRDMAISILTEISLGLLEKEYKEVLYLLKSGTYAQQKHSHKKLPRQFTKDILKKINLEITNAHGDHRGRLKAS